MAWSDKLLYAVMKCLARKFSKGNNLPKRSNSVSAWSPDCYEISIEQIAPFKCASEHEKLCSQIRSVQDGSGAFEPILPKEELEAMYHRILAQEIPLPSSAGAGDQQPGAERRKGLQASRLAAALGLSHLFRCDCSAVPLLIHCRAPTKPWQQI